MTEPDVTPADIGMELLRQHQENNKKKEIDEETHPT